MGPANRNLKEVITYWAQGNSNNDFGIKAWQSPVKMKGRWEVSDMEIMNKDGVQVTSTAHVALDGVVAVEGWIAEGDQTAYLDPTTVPGAREIQAFQSKPDLRLMEQRHVAYL